MLGYATVLAAILSLVGAQGPPTTPSVCAVGCVNGVFVNAANMGCANGDTLCVCGKPESYQAGIRDCITAACAPDGPDVQIPLAEVYGQETCAKAQAGNPPPPPPAAPISSTEAPAPEPTPVEATSSATPTSAAPSSSTTPAAISSTSTAGPSTESPSQSTATSTAAASTASSSSTSDSKPTTTPAETSTTPESTSVSPLSTTSGTPQPAATSGTSSATSELSTAVKAGIGAGVGAAALAAIIITVCACLRHRQRKKTANRVRNYKISEPMSISGDQFANDIGRAETGLPRAIITGQRAQVDTMGMPTSPTSVYSSSSDLESHARRYEDMPPRTQPRTMI
ncbi:hypothetical protein NUW58_g6910 [Xylaria curta]|uniref:Uncharacterized protein n=1 Tax=Xylaria curta TaxID=42375 RepID=A0ACC1NNT5_9PEZI|nr:hypothetical protein NUW58_g6910 [Xylaria curta]